MLRTILIVSLFFLSQAIADTKATSIEGNFEAYFPQRPEFEGEFGVGENRHRGFNYTDNDNLVVFSATYQTGRYDYSDRELPQALKNYAKGGSISVRGQLDNYEGQVLQGNVSAIYYTTYEMQGILVRKFTVTSYKNGRFYSWSVQDIPGYSKKNANTIFLDNLSRFRVK